MMPSDTTVTREHVSQWIDEFNELEDPGDTTLEDWIRAKLTELDLHEAEVMTVGHDHLGDTTPLVDMILMDLPSYPNASGSTSS
jgi:hypothetical protein